MAVVEVLQSGKTQDAMLATCEEERSPHRDIFQTLSYSDTAADISGGGRRRNRERGRRQRNNRGRSPEVGGFKPEEISQIGSIVSGLT